MEKSPFDLSLMVCSHVCVCGFKLDREPFFQLQAIGCVIELRASGTGMYRSWIVVLYLDSHWSFQWMVVLIRCNLNCMQSQMNTAHHIGNSCQTSGSICFFKGQAAMTHKHSSSSHSKTTKQALTGVRYMGHRLVIFKGYVGER
jgi:hypothetical protein